MRRAARTDRNHAEVRRALRAAGCTVTDLSRLGGVIPDLLVRPPGRRAIFVEVKDGALPPSERRLTPAEVAMHDRLRETGASVYVVTSAAEALALVGAKP